MPFFRSISSRLSRLIPPPLPHRPLSVACARLTPFSIAVASQPIPHPVTRISPQRRQFSASTCRPATLMQVLRGCRGEQKARRGGSPALSYRPQLKGVCLKVGTLKPKKPNSGERKYARVRLSTSKVVTAYIGGIGHNVQQHSVVLVRGGRAPDCPGVKYHLVRGALDLGGVSGRMTSRSKYGTKMPKSV